MDKRPAMACETALQGAFFQREMQEQSTDSLLDRDTRNICTTHQAKRKKNMSKKDVVQY